MESWRKVFREAVVPQLSRRALEALRDGLASDSPELIQGATTNPPPLSCNEDRTPTAACLLGYCAWRGEDLHTIGAVESRFASLCAGIDERMGGPSGCRWLLNWYDEAPREHVRRELLAECDLALNDSTAVDKGTPA